jgi:hypothetical protein
MEKIRFHIFKMILNIHSDASYLSETGARSRACGHFFMGWMPKDNEPIQIIGGFNTNSTTMRFVVASTTEAKLGAVFHNCQTGIIFDKNWTTLVTLNPKHPSIELMHQQLALQIIQLKARDQDLLK